MSHVIVPYTHFGSGFLGHWNGVKYGKAVWYTVQGFNAIWSFYCLNILCLFVCFINPWHIKQRRWVRQVIFNICRSKFKKHRQDIVFFISFKQRGLFIILFCTNRFCFIINPQPLADALKKALKSDFEEVVLALLMTPSEYDAFEVKQAMRVQLLTVLIAICCLNLHNNTRMSLIIRVLGQMRPS